MLAAPTSRHLRRDTAMRSPLVTAALVAAAALLAVIAAPGQVTAYASDATPTPEPTATPAPTSTPEPTATPAPRTIVIGKSVRGRAIKLVRFGSGKRRILIVGGIHGDEAGTPVARAFLAYVRAHPSVVPSGTELDIVVAANPDGVAAKMRGNANRIDLNRNFPSRDWRRLRFGKLTSGRRAGSQPETKALVKLMKRRYVRVISLHSKGSFTDGAGKGGVTLARKMAKAAGIKRVNMSRFGSYPGSMGSYAPERYPKSAYVVWELSSRKLTKRVRAGLIVGVR